MSPPARDRPLRVGFLIDRWDSRRGGAERALATFAAWLEARGYEVYAFGLKGPPPGDSSPGTFIPVKARGLTRSKRELRLASTLIESAAAKGCDATIGVRHLAKCDLYWPHGGAHAATLRALGKRARGRHRAFLALESGALADGGARRIVCVSELVRQEMLECYPTCAGRLECVPNGLDTDRFCLAAREEARRELLALGGGPSREPILTFVGRNAQLKGLPILLKALARLQDRSWRLVVAGPRDAARWSRLSARQFDRPDRVTVAKDMDSLMLAAGSDLLILPSRREACGLVVLEALATGTPVLVSSAVGAKEVLTDQEQGAVFNVDVGEEQLARLISDQLDRIEFGTIDRRRVALAVADRGLRTWMSAMERQLLEIVSTPPVR